MTYNVQEHQTVVRFLRLLLKSLSVRMPKETLKPYIAVVDKYESSGSHGMTPDEIDRYNELLEKAKLI